MDFLGGIIALSLLLILYFLPFLIAAHRRHCNMIAIGLTNLLLGWTFLGWVIALIWSSTYQTKTVE